MDEKAITGLILDLLRPYKDENVGSVLLGITRR